MPVPSIQKKILIQGARVLDPGRKVDAQLDILIERGKIVRVASKIAAPKSAERICARGLWAFPGLVDVHVHLREPGMEHSETIATGTQAAVAGGVTSVIAMANTNPTTDTPQRLQFILQKAKKVARCHVYAVSSVTKNLAGAELVNFTAMARAGCAAFSDDGRCEMSNVILRDALFAAKNCHRVLIEHAEDFSLTGPGVMHAGSTAKALGLAGIPAETESVIVARDIELVRLSKARLHFAHISTARAVELIRRAKAEKIPVTAETCPHYFSLTDSAVRKHGANAKMKPPLRTEQDRRAILAGLADGTIDTISTDHAPHAPELKAKGMQPAPFGILGLETSFALAYEELILKKILSPLETIQKMSSNPAKIFALPAGTLQPGAQADIALFDPKQTWTYQESFSKSKNSPFWGKRFKGRIKTTFVAGKKVYDTSAI